jgi:hypothetical protein
MAQGRSRWFFLITFILLLISCSILQPGRQVQPEQNSPTEEITPSVSSTQEPASLPPTATRATPRQKTRQVKLTATNTVTPAPTNTIPLAAVSITLGTPQQIFHMGHPDAMGMFNVPDMHTAVLQQPDKSYLLWITGNIGPSGGSIAMLSTKDFIHYANASPGAPTKAKPVMAPSCAKGDSSCRQNYDADYVGANSVITASNGKDLLMFYEAGNKSIGSSQPGGWEYNVMALARSSDNGSSWTRQGVVLSGSDPKPNSVGTTQPGVSEPGTIVANGYIYMFYQYVPNQDAEPEAPSVIQVARAPVASDGAPGSWTKYSNGAWGEPGLGGKAATIVATGKGSGCTRPVQVWPAFSQYLNAYVLTFLCNEGWFFSTSTDLVTWASPTQFLDMTMWRQCQPMDLNYILVTPGNPGGMIGQTGYVLYASTPSHGGGCSNMVVHELWVRSFTFSKGP